MSVLQNSYVSLFVVALLHNQAINRQIMTRTTKMERKKHSLNTNKQQNDL